LDRIHTSDHIGSVDWIGLDRLILLKCDTHSEHMVTIGMGKQVRSTGYDNRLLHVICSYLKLDSLIRLDVHMEQTIAMIEDELLVLGATLKVNCSLLIKISSLTQYS
jgi:hypothetical protein